MGTFDTIYFIDEPLTCGEGHKLLSGFQTKDLACDCDSYIVYNKHLYRDGRTRIEPDSFVFEQGELALLASYKCEFPLVGVTDTVRIYTSCKYCRPIVVIPAAAWTGEDAYQDWSLWVEWEVEFLRGEVLSVMPNDVKTRAELRQHLAEEGHQVFDDDAPQAIRHLMSLPEYQRGPWWPEEWNKKKRIQRRP